jgi:protein-export membrane protein SecD
MKLFSKKYLFIFFAVAFLLLYALPQNLKALIPQERIKNHLLSFDIKLGLDLQGGTQLDYIVDLDKVYRMNEEEEDVTQHIDVLGIVEGVRATLERRVNALGVAEPNIYTAEYAGEHHIIVELAGIQDIEEAKRIVGKTIQLEFKEYSSEIDENRKETIKKEAEKTLEEIKNGADFNLTGQRKAKPDGSIEFTNVSEFQDQIPEAYREELWNAETGKVLGPFESVEGYEFNMTNQIEAKEGFVLAVPREKMSIEREKEIPAENFVDHKTENIQYFIQEEVSLDSFPEEVRKELLEKKPSEITDIYEINSTYNLYKLLSKKEGGKEEIQARHILVSYEGAERSESTRTKIEAKKRAEEALEKIKNGADFETIVLEYSDGPSKDKGGDLGFFAKGAMTPAFEEVAFALPLNEISDITETSFGFHIIQKTGEKEPSADLYTVERLEANEKAVLEDLQEVLVPRKVKEPDTLLVYDKIFYSLREDPWKETELDGSKFIRASVSSDSMGGAFVLIDFNEEGGELFSEITKRNSGKPLAIFVGGTLVSAPMVQGQISTGNAQITGNFTLREAVELAQNLNTGAIAAPVLLSGQHQIGATIGEQAFNISLYAGILGVIALALFMILKYKFFGFIANIALLFYALVLVFILKTSGMIGAPIVLTLAGIAGIVLSLGMAVDANILIFERIKEEIQDGKNVPLAITIGFERAWSSIRDSNISSLITCFILAWFGTSIIRGFAINLALGLLISLFTAMVVTKSLLFLFCTQKEYSKYLLGDIKK